MGFIAGIMNTMGGSGVLSSLAMTAAMPVAFKGAGMAWKAGMPIRMAASGMKTMALRGGPLGRAAVGGIVGGVGAALTNPYQDSNNAFERVASGALGGAFLGGVAPTAARAWGKMARRTVLPAGVSAMKGGASLAANAAGFAWRNPYLAAGVAGAAVGGGAIASNIQNRSIASPTLSGGKVNTAYNRQQNAMAEMTGGTGNLGSGMIGTAPQMMGQYHRAMVQSTDGLVQGLHRGRH